MTGLYCGQSTEISKNVAIVYLEAWEKHKNLKVTRR